MTTNGKSTFSFFSKISIGLFAFTLISLYVLLDSSVLSTKTDLSLVEDDKKYPQIEVGDWIVRKGTGYESQIIQKISASSYSHIGVIIQTQPKIQIIHATTDDHPQYLNQVIKSDLAEFTQLKLAEGWAIYRPTILSAAQRKSIAYSVLKQQGQPFILGLKTEQHRYCTTIIAEHLPLQLQAQLQWDKIDMPGLKGEILFPSALINLAGVDKIYESSRR